MHYYLGIDGGGTRTTAAVSDKNGNIILKKTGRTINFYSVGTEAARNNLAVLLSEIEDETGINEFSAAFIGCSALDNEADSMLTDKLCKGIINARKLMLHSDLYIALRSAGQAEYPCVAVAGTGSMAICEDKDGKTTVTGGWGHILGDEGSAYAIAVEALSECARIYDNDEKNELIDEACSFFGVTDFRAAIDKIYSAEATKDVIARFAENTGKAAISGNKTAEGIIKRQAELFAETVLKLLNKMSCCDVLGLYGGVFQYNSQYTQIFSQKIKSVYPGIEIKLITVPPEESAAELARKL